MPLNSSSVKETYDNINKATGNHLLSILLSAIILVMPALVYAGSLWVEQSIQKQVSQQMLGIKTLIKKQRQDYLQDQLYSIEDKKIDGTITNADKKRAVRLRQQLQDLK